MIRAISAKQYPNPLRHFQASHSAGTSGEPILFEAMTVENAQEEIRQRVIVFRVESQVLAVLESTAGEKGWHIPIIVGTAVAKIGGHEHTSSIEHSAIGLFCSLQVAQEISPAANESGFYEGKLAKLIFIEPVVT